jgi:hypothetical protein
MLLQRLMHIKKVENEVVKDFHANFNRMSQKIPRIHRPVSKFLRVIYIREFLEQSNFFLDKRNPTTIQEDYDMATKVEDNILSSKVEFFFAPQVKIDDPKDTPETLSLERITSLEISKRWEQEIDLKETKERDLDKGYQSHDEEKEFTHDSIKEDLVEGKEPKEREILISASPSDEAIQGPIPHPQDEENEANHFPFQFFHDALFYDLEGEEVLEDPLDVLNPSCYDKNNDVIDNIDEFIHVGRHKWDVIGSDEDPIYDMEGHFHLFPLQQSYDVPNKFDVWQQDDDIITDVFQAPKGDLVLCSPDDF